jgi:Na+-driven multidrug efflux pump
MFLYLLVVKPFTFGTWAGWTCESLSIMRSYMKLAIPGALMGCLEWWSFEIVGMAAGSLGGFVFAVTGAAVGFTAYVDSPSSAV